MFSKAESGRRTFRKRRVKGGHTGRGREEEKRKKKTDRRGPVSVRASSCAKSLKTNAWPYNNCRRGGRPTLDAIRGDVRRPLK